VIAQPPIQFDRTTGVLEGASAWERLAALALSSGSKVASAFSHRGYNSCANLLRRTLPERDIAIKLNSDATFEFPYGDGYWSKLLNRSFSYEDELELLFRDSVGVDYTLIDCGATSLVAMNKLAIDRNAIIKDLLLGYARPVDSPVPPGLIGHTSLPAKAYDPEKARQILKQAGYSNVTLDFVLMKDLYPKQLEISQAVAARLGNTPAVCRRCYIHPAVLGAYSEGRLRAPGRGARRSVSRGRSGLMRKVSPPSPSSRRRSKSTPAARTRVARPLLSRVKTSFSPC